MMIILTIIRSAFPVVRAFNNSCFKTDALIRIRSGITIAALDRGAAFVIGAAFPSFSDCANAPMGSAVGRMRLRRQKEHKRESGKNENAQDGMAWARQEGKRANASCSIHHEILASADTSISAPRMCANARMKPSVSMRFSMDMKIIFTKRR